MVHTLSWCECNRQENEKSPLHIFLLAHWVWVKCFLYMWPYLPWPNTIKPHTQERLRRVPGTEYVFHSLYYANTVISIDSSTGWERNWWITCTTLGDTVKGQRYEKELGKLWHMCIYTSIYTNMYFVHMYETCMPRFSPSDSSGPPGVSSRSLGSHLSTPYVQCVYVCAYTHTYTHILPPALRIKKTQTTPLSLFLSQNKPPCQTTSVLIH